MKRTCILLFSLCMFSFSFNYGAANELTSSSLKEVKLSFDITLLADTPIYMSPNGNQVPIGVLAAQHVHAIGALDNWLTYRTSTDKKWFKVETWLGDAWLPLELRQTGNLQPTDLDVWLAADARLYDSPYADSESGRSIVSQTIHVRERYLSKFISSYKVDTRSGEKWIVDAPYEVFPVTKIYEKLELTTATSKFRSPMPSDGDLGMLEPQSVIALLRYQQNWYQVVTSQGEKVWINKKFAEPTGVKQTDESVNISVRTPLQKYPNVYEINMGAIAPQTVKAFETWKSPEDEMWYHIHSWQGDAWIRDGKIVKITKEMAMASAKQMDPEGDALWTAELVNEFQLEPSDEIRTVWSVTAVYSAGNKMVVFIDAATGKQVALAEIEARGVDEN